MPVEAPPSSKRQAPSSSAVAQSKLNCSWFSSVPKDFHESTCLKASQSTFNRTNMSLLRLQLGFKMESFKDQLNYDQKDSRHRTMYVRWQASAVAILIEKLLSCSLDSFFKSQEISSLIRTHWIEEIVSRAMLCLHVFMMRLSCLPRELTRKTPSQALTERSPLGIHNDPAVKHYHTVEPPD